MCVDLFWAVYQAECQSWEYIETLNRNQIFFFKKGWGDFSGSPVVKTSPSNAGSVGLTPCQGTKTPTCLEVKKPENIKQRWYLTNSVGTLKMVHILKKSL